MIKMNDSENSIHQRIYSRNRIRKDYIMKLYIVSTEDYGYDEYDSVVVAAIDEEEARSYADERLSRRSPPDTWDVKEIGTALPGLSDILHSSFNAG